MTTDKTPDVTMDDIEAMLAEAIRNPHSGAAETFPAIMDQPPLLGQDEASAARQALVIQAMTEDIGGDWEKFFEGYPK